MACSTGCPTGDHKTWGECLRAKSLRTAVSIPGIGWDRSAQSQWDKRLDSYDTARAQGIQPEGTKSSQIQHAVRESDRVGKPFSSGV